MSHVQQFNEANKTYMAGFGGNGSLDMPPARPLIVLTCIDARLIPTSALGLKEGDAHVIRNAGGVAPEAIRSILVSQRLLNTRQIAVFHHTDCGMMDFTTRGMRKLVKEAAPGNEAVAKAIDAIPTFYEFTDLEEACKRDVKYLQEHPLVAEGTVITGWIHEVETGRVRQIA